MTIVWTMIVIPIWCFSQNGYTDSIAAQKFIPVPQQKYQDHSFFPAIGNELYEQANAPFGLSDRQALMVGEGVVITVTLIALDQKIDNIFSPLDNHYRFFRRTSPQLTDFGGSRGIVTAGVFGVYSVIWDDTRSEHTTILITEALITSGLWARFGKIIFSRERPSASYEFSHRSGGEWHWLPGFFKQGFQTPAQYDAFPSGHTITAFAIASVVSEEYGNSPLVPPIAYTIASTIGVTRLIEHAHWASDVFVGGVIGYLCGKQVVRYNNEATHPGEVNSQLSLSVLDERPALQFTMNF